MDTARQRPPMFYAHQGGESMAAFYVPRSWHSSALLVTFAPLDIHEMFGHCAVIKRTFLHQFASIRGYDLLLLTGLVICSTWSGMCLASTKRESIVCDWFYLVSPGLGRFGGGLWMDGLLYIVEKVCGDYHLLLAVIFGMFDLSFFVFFFSFFL